MTMQDSKPWIFKYKPKTSKEIIGQDKAIKQITDFIGTFKRQKKKAILAYGPNGCGKTASIHAIAREQNLEVIEINASDSRNKDQIESIIGNATQQLSLFASGKIILIDEIDGVAGHEDRGGIAAITGLIDKSSFPIILTANDPWDKKFSGLRSNCVLAEFRTLEYTDVFKMLEKISSAEGISISQDALKSLARRSDGDMRAAINDLATISQSKEPITLDDLDTLSARNQHVDMTTALMKIFKTSDLDIASKAFEDADEDLEKCALWVDENLPKEYQKPGDLARAYDAMSRADVFSGRIRRQQHWHFLVYVSALLSAGVAAAKDERYRGMANYVPTGRILKIWKANMMNQKRNAIASKIADRMHTSDSRAIHDILPYVRVIARNGKGFAKEFGKEFNLDKDEIEWLTKK